MGTNVRASVFYVVGLAVIGVGACSGPLLAADESSSADTKSVVKPASEATDSTALKATAADAKTADVKASEVKASDVKPADIQTWIKDLDSEEFSTRQAAKQKLSDAGAPAIEALAEAAENNSLEVAMQSFDILRKHFESPDDKLKLLAKGALERLAKSPSRAVARRAGEVLDLRATQKPNANNNGQPGGIQIQGGNIQLVPGAGNARIQIQVQAQNNGEKNIEVHENGRKVSIKENKGGIRVAVTENNKTEEYMAKDVEELKKNHPEGHKIYEKYGRGQGNIQVGAIQIPLQLPAQLPNAVPLPARNLVPQPANPATTKLRLEALKRQIDSMRQKLESIKANDDKAAIKSTSDKLEEAQRELDEAIRKLDAK